MNRRLDAVDAFARSLIFIDAAQGEDEGDDEFDSALDLLLADDEEFSIFLSDLTPEAQERYLRWLGEAGDENNFEISPLVILSQPE